MKAIGYKVLWSWHGDYWHEWWTYPTLVQAKNAEQYLHTVRRCYVRIEEVKGE